MDSLKLYVNGKLSKIKRISFPAGETLIALDEIASFIYVDDIYIELNFKSNADLIDLALLVDAIRRWTGAGIHLSMPYFPYARQDRVCNLGESLSVKVIADMINAMNFEHVHVIDPHSEVLGAILNNMTTTPMVHYVQIAKRIIYRDMQNNNFALVSPDAGANKKVMGYAKYLDGIDVIRSDKTRDTKTGNITGTVVFSGHLGNTNLLVVDDILDGGGTFIPLAAELRKITDGTISLLVSHGIFTKGVDIFKGVFDNLFVVNNMCGESDIIQDIKL